MNLEKKFVIDDNLKKSIFFVIPVFNEEKVIGKLISNLNNLGYYNLILVNDGSSDNSDKEILKYEKNGVILLNHVINRGQGAALQTGKEFASKQKNCKYIVTFDSDGQHRISDLEKFIEILEKEKDIEIVIGSRFLTKETEKLVPKKKRALLKVAIFITWLLSNIWLSDTHNGYRVMRRKTSKKIEITMDGYEHASEIIDIISKKKIKYKEVPVYIDYTDYSKNKGQKMTNAVKIFLKILFK